MQLMSRHIIGGTYNIQITENFCLFVSLMMVFTNSEKQKKGNKDVDEDVAAPLS